MEQRGLVDLSTFPGASGQVDEAVNCYLGGSS